MSPETLRSIEAWIVSVPLLEEWAASPEFGGHPGESRRLILRFLDRDGREGWGEGPGALPADAIGSVLQRFARLPLSGWRLPLLELAPKPSYFELPLPPSEFAPHPGNVAHRLRHPLQTAFETAALDLLARRAGVPLHLLFGGAWRDRVPVDYWMGRTTPEHAARCVQRGRSLGFTGIKLKAALEDPNVERLEAIRDAGGPEWTVTVDPNGRFYRLDDAFPVISAMDAVGNMTILEDPFPRIHLHEFAALRPRIRARVVVHIEPPESLHGVIQSGAAGGLNLDSHTQGLLSWRFQAAAAAQANLAVWHGSNLDLGIATAAQLHLAAATPNCQLPGDQSGPWLRAATLITTPFEVVQGHVLVPPGPGLGVAPDRAAIDRYATQHWMTADE